MARVWVCGFETGDFSECGGTSAGTNSVQSTTVRSGNYAAKFNAGGVSYRESTTGLNLATAFYRFYFFVASLPPAPNNGEFFAGIANSSDLDIAKPGLNSDGTIRVINSATGVNVVVATGTQIVIAGAWNLLEWKMVISAGSGIIETKLNGVLDTSTTGLTTNGRGNVDRVYVGPGAGDLGVDIYFDDGSVDDAAYCGPARIIARQFKSGSPTYDAWTKTSGAIDANWDDTPFSAGTNASSFLSSTAQTALISSFGATQSGHGTEFIQSADTLIGMKVALVGKTAATTATGITEIGTSQSGSSTAGANITLTFSVAPQAGDIALLIGGFGTAGASNPGPSTAGYTALFTDNATATRRFGVWYKAMGATPDTTVIGLGSGSAGDGVAYMSVVLRQADNNTLPDITVTSASGSSTNPDPPTSGATVTANDWIIAAACSAVNDTAKGTQTSFTQFAGSPSANATRPFSCTASHLTTPPAAGVDTNPAAWSAWSTGAWRAVTIALRPGTDAGSAASIRRRFASVDTDTAITLTTSDAYYETAILTPPAYSALNAGEVGVLHGSNSLTQTVEDAWVFVEYAPNRFVRRPVRNLYFR